VWVVLLSVSNLEAGYGAAQVLWGVSLRVARGSFTAVLGPNGAGKTTLLNTIMGFIRPWNGSVEFNGADITREPPHRKVEMGINIVPEGRRLFPNLTVRENLLLAARSKRAKNSVDSSLELVFTLFPVLKERLGQKAGTLSGGEQQMLAIARALMTRPELILMDEPSQGLAPKIALEVFMATKKLREVEKTSILLVEQNISLALEVSDQVYVLDHGKIIAEGAKEEIIREASEILNRLVGL